MNHSGYTNRKDNEHLSFLGAHFMGCDDTRKKYEDISDLYYFTFPKQDTEISC